MDRHGAGVDGGSAHQVGRRSPVLTDLPSVAESGLADYEISGWFGILRPADQPQPVTQRLNAESLKVTREPDLKPRLASLGADPLTNSPEQFSAYLRSEIDQGRTAICFANRETSPVGPRARRKTWSVPD